MTRIRQMSEALANRIAAGEVVERPASVVKELVENSLDAGATSIRVEMIDGGLTRLTVEDDGCGMDAEDAELCFARHATSKLIEDSDLLRIATMGFRGEALATIASVAKVTLRTSTGEGEGRELVVVPGAPTVAREVRRRRGSTFVVSDLFFNTPARRQFLKTERGEAGAVQTWMTRLALANPQIAFGLSDGKRQRLSVPGAVGVSAEQQRCETLLGAKMAGGLFPCSGARDEVSVAGFVGRPDLSRRDRRGIHLFINGRAIDDRRLEQAVIEGYRSVMEVGRFPVAVLQVEVGPGLVDVNVHPQKTEVRLAQPRLIFSLVRNAVAEALIDAPWLDAAVPVGMEVSDSRAGEALRAAYAQAKPTALPVRQPLASVFGMPGPQRAFGGAPRPAPTIPAAEPVSAAPQPRLLTGTRYADLRAIGQVGNTYLLLEGPEGLVAIDQHAAHERIVFGQLRAAMLGEALVRQGLLIPAPLNLDAEEAEALWSRRDAARNLGFELLQDDAGALALSSVPALLAGADPVRMIEDLSGVLAAGEGEGGLDDALDAAIARLACHGSIRAGQTLSHAEIATLMEDLDRAEHRSHCPHGRPFVRQLGMDQLEDWFHR
jgi:DNA mismatch repair protein MutL